MNAKMILYQIVYCVCLLFYIPVLLWKKKPILKKIFPSIHVSEPYIWIHSASVGESLAVASLAKKIHEKYPYFAIVVSAGTLNGLETAKKAIPFAHTHILLPFDMWFCVRRLFAHQFPHIIILSEGDVWPCFLHVAKQKGTNCIVVNGKISQKSCDRLKIIPSIGTWLFSFIDFFCVQNQEYKERLCCLGVDKQRVCVCGNIKADMYISHLTGEQKAEWQEKLGLDPSDKLIVVGSTHDPEEERIAQALYPLCNKAKVVIVPRHPERSLQIYHTLRSEFSNVVLFSEHIDMPWNIMIFDMLGALTYLYQLAYVAIVAGSFTDRIGGHNILEPALFSVPIVVGPHMHTQQSLVDSAQDQHAIIISSYEKLRHNIANLIHNDDVYHTYAQNAKQWANSLQGALERTFECIASYF